MTVQRPTTARKLARIAVIAAVRGAATTTGSALVGLAVWLVTRR